MFESIKKMFSKKQEKEIESETIEVVEDEVVEYCRDPIIELTEEDVKPISDLQAQNAQIRAALGPMRMQYLATEQNYIDKIKSNNVEINRVLSAILTTYNVDPDVDYELNFPDEEGGLPSLKKL